MNPFFKALQSGYNEDDILGYISKALPSFVKPISKAKSLGYPAKQILGFLSKNFDTENRRGMSESERHAANHRADSERTKFGLKTAAAAAASPIAAGVVGNALSRALPNGLNLNLNSAQTNNSVQPSGVTPPVQPTSPSNANGMNQNAPASATTPETLLSQNSQSSVSSQPPINSQNITQTPKIEQPKEIPTTLESREDVLWDALQKGKTKGPDAATSGMLKLAKQMMSTGQINSKEDFDRFSHLFTQKMQESKSLPKALREAGNEYSNAKKNPVALQEQPSMEPEGEKLDVSEETPKIESKSTVITPHGFGEVKAIRNGKAIVDVDGKKHQIDEDELESSPLPEKELADLFNDLISGIEKETGQEVSKNVEWAGYDPKTNELAYKPHQGDRLYVYEDISPEDVEMLTGLLTQRKTTGENFLGIWKKDTTSPIGAAMYQLIQKLQKERGGKGNEYKNRYETIYSALEPAVKASKRKHAELKKKAKKPKIT